MKFRTHDVAVARAEEAVIHAAADAKFGDSPRTDAWYAECQILRLQQDADAGLMDCYEGYDNVDWQADFGSGWVGWPGIETSATKQIQLVIDDPRLPAIAKTILERDGFDMMAELALCAEAVLGIENDHEFDEHGVKS